jgi:hypothetical protein
MAERQPAARVLAVLALAAAACGGETVPKSGFTSSPELAASFDAVAAAATHPVAFELDAKIREGKRPVQIDAMVGHAARAATHDLAALKRHEPYVFERVAPRLQRIEFRHGGGEARTATWSGTTLVLTSLYRWDLLSDGDLADVLRTMVFDDLERRFGSREPGQVTEADRRDYFVYAVHPRTPGHGGPSPNAPATPLAIERVVRLSAVLGSSDPALASEVRRWLFARANDMVSPTPKEDAPDLLRTRAAWVSWLDGVLPGATAAEKLEVARAVYGQGWAAGKGNRDNELSGFDAFAFGLAVVDAWIAAGHPTTRAPGEPSSDLVDLVVCPPIYEHDGRLSREDGNFSPWVRRAFFGDTDLRRLVDALAARGDAALTAAVVYNLPSLDRVPVRARFLRELERHPRAWQVAMLRLIAEERSEGCDEGLFEEANHVWREVPELRGTALHVIACKEARWRGVSDPFFVELPRRYGQSVGAPLFASFLDDGTDAMKLADVVWPAMSKGWSRVAVLLPRLDAFLSDPKVLAGADGEPMQTLLAIGARLCEDGETAEIARLHEALAARARNDASRARALAKVLEETSPGRCERKRRPKTR